MIMCPVTRVAAVSNAIPAKISVFYKNEILSKIKNKENENSKIKEFNIRFNNEIKKILSDFIDDDISIFINDNNKDKFSKDFNDSCKDKNEDFNNKFRDKSISLFAGIGNNMNVYNKLMNLKMNKRCKNKNDNFRYYNSDKNIKGF